MIEDDQLMFDERRLGNHGANAARTHESHKSSEAQGNVFCKEDLSRCWALGLCFRVWVS